MQVSKAFIYKDNEIEELQLGEFFDGNYEHPLINVYNVEKSKFIGFGGAFTDSSAFNYAMLPMNEKKRVLTKLFTKEGLNYRFCRLCIGSSDFSPEVYDYLDGEDYSLESFSIARDKKYIIPFLQDALKIANNEITLFASPWSPPAFMKDNNSRFKGGKLLKQNYELYAEYLVKFIKAYQELGIEIKYITPQNEPKASQTWDSCFYSKEDELEFIKVLASKIKSEHLNTEIICWDHNKERMYERADYILKGCEEVSGVGFHWYSGDHFDAVDLVRKQFPNKLILETEFCVSFSIDEVNSSYANEIAHSLKSDANGICEWNLLLDENGGPYHNRKGGCGAPIRIDSKTLTSEETYIYKQMYMFSHFIEVGSVGLYTSTYSKDVYATAHRNPNGEIVVVIFNNSNSSRNMAKLYMNGKFLSIPLTANSIISIVIKEN